MIAALRFEQGRSIGQRKRQSEIIIQRFSSAKLEPQEPQRRTTMAMAVGGQGSGPSADINVTPLIDVLLVLLIIFMVITPMTPNRTIVVQLLDRGPGQTPALKINQEDTTWENLQGRLTDIFKTRAEKVMFVKGDNNIPFADVADVIDIGHAGGVDKVGLITAKIEAGG